MFKNKLDRKQAVKNALVMGMLTGLSMYLAYEEGRACAFRSSQGTTEPEGETVTNSEDFPADEVTVSRNGTGHPADESPEPNAESDITVPGE